MRRHWAGFTLPAAMLMALTVAVAWLLRSDLQEFTAMHPAILPVVILALAVLCLLLAAILWIESEALRGQWRRRSQVVTGLDSLAPGPVWLQWLKRLPDPLEWLAKAILRTRIGHQMARDWAEAGLGPRPSRYLLVLVLSALMGWLLGDRIGGRMLGLALATMLPLLPRNLVRSQAEGRRRRFGEQLPQALDALSAGLAAGLSFQQAVDYAGEELPHPVAATFKRLSRRMRLGYPAENALKSLLNARKEHGLALLVEGIILQRRFGGDLVRMMEDMAALLRERVELEREVRAVTTQGRLSGYVIGALVPVSAGLLLMLNPRYIDVLFDTLIGQALVILVLLLQIAGWVIISRMVRFRY